MRKRDIISWVVCLAVLVFVSFDVFNHTTSVESAPAPLPDVVLEANEIKKTLTSTKLFDGGWKTLRPIRKTQAPTARTTSGLLMRAEGLHGARLEPFVSKVFRPGMLLTAV